MSDQTESIKTSPFPGMDPYIEACGLWEDFHSHLIEQLAQALASSIPDRYVVRTGERAYLVLAMIPTEYKEAFIDIYALHPQRRLVTTIEVLSPSNKRFGSEGWELYLRKRRGLLLGTANLVEIDLLRGGQRMPMLDPWPDSTYTLLVAKRELAPACRVWRAGMRSPLPTIPIPLSPPDGDVRLSLQPLIASIYSQYRYDQDIDYARPLNPPLGEEDAAWLDKQLHSRTPA